jgi:hypothetical protein
MLPEKFGMFAGLGVLFGAVAATCAYLIAYAEYRQRMLHPRQSPRRMALDTAVATFVFFVVASAILAWVL